MSRTRSPLSKEKSFTTIPPEGGGGGGDGTPTTSPYYWMPITDDGRRSSAVAPSPTLGEKYVVPANASGGWPISTAGRFQTGDGTSWANSYGETGLQAYVVREISGGVLTDIPSAGFGAVSGNATVTSQVDGQYWLPDFRVDALHSKNLESAISRTITTPPTAPANYLQYIIPSGATGVWSGKDNKVALSVSEHNTGVNTWVYRTPIGGEELYLEDEQVKIWYNPTTNQWESIATRIRFQDLADVVGPFDSSTDGYTWTWDDTTGKMTPTSPGALSPHALGDHTDTNWSSPPGAGQDGKVPVWVNGSSEFQLGIPSMVLNDLTDVSGTPNVGDVLGWNGSWAPVSLGGGSPHALGSHTDTSFGTPGAGQDAHYVGFVNAGGPSAKYQLLSLKEKIALTDLTDVNTAGGVPGNSLVLTGGGWVPGTPNVAAALKGASVTGRPDSGLFTVEYDTVGGLVVPQSSIYTGLRGKFLIPAGYNYAVFWACFQGGGAYFQPSAQGGVVNEYFTSGSGTTLQARSQMGTTFSYQAYSAGGTFQMSIGATQLAYSRPLPVIPGRYYGPASATDTIQYYGIILYA